VLGILLQIPHFHTRTLCIYEVAIVSLLSMVERLAVTVSSTILGLGMRRQTRICNGGVSDSCESTVSTHQLLVSTVDLRAQQSKPTPYSTSPCRQPTGPFDPDFRFSTSRGESPTWTFSLCSRLIPQINRLLEWAFDHR
jgi:hypothetical protein